MKQETTTTKPCKYEAEASKGMDFPKGYYIFCTKCIKHRNKYLCGRCRDYQEAE